MQSIAPPPLHCAAPFDIVICVYPMNLQEEEPPLPTRGDVDRLQDYVEAINHLNDYALDWRYLRPVADVAQIEVFEEHPGGDLHFVLCTSDRYHILTELSKALPGLRLKDPGIPA